MGKNWTIKHSDNYIFHYMENSLGEEHIDEIVRIQELCNKHISKVLKVSMKDKIKYFLCNSREEVGASSGDKPRNRFSRMPDEIWAVYNESNKCIGYHEDAHIISYNTLGIPECIFIREGLAMYFEKVWFGIENRFWVHEYLRNNKYVDIGSLINNNEFCRLSDTLTYPIAGAFTEYLISVFGMDKFKRFYVQLSTLRTIGFKRNFKEVFQQSLEDVEENFKNYILSIKPNNIIEKEISQNIVGL
ncbi:hypothetical protein [Clostridium sp.]|uniref:hypothetical protein n=1 Tax=Clostridium sp. TaxID=1506 RepID=UPI003464C389